MRAPSNPVLVEHEERNRRPLPVEAIARIWRDGTTPAARRAIAQINPQLAFHLDRLMEVWPRRQS